MQRKVLFLTLRVFSVTGGIEKVSRLVGKALYELGLQYGGIAEVYSMYGRSEYADNNRYFPQLMFRAFNDNKIWFVIKSILSGRRSQYLVMSHINLLIVGYLVKLFRPSVKLVWIAHGIEVWRPLPAWKRYMLRRCDLILPVSHFTQQKMLDLYHLDESKFSVFNNCLEPFLEKPLHKEKSETLLNRYGFTKENRIMLTVSRMAESEKYKGYDKVLQAMPALLDEHPGIRYLLVGKYDASEKKRLDELIRILKLEPFVAFSGFVADEEMPAHFSLADLFIMPSEKEGFGIVFIEAMFYGLPVIAGNADGSVDALCKGELGILIDPQSIPEIRDAIRKVLENREAHVPDQSKLYEHFSYSWYKRKLNHCLDSLAVS